MSAGTPAGDWLTGVGLHTGVMCRARWVRSTGPLRVQRIDGASSEVDVSLTAAVRTERATRLRLGDGRTVETVEHALAAASARGWSKDITLEVDGPEVPLGDGASAAWCTRVATLGVPTEGARIDVVRAWEGTVDGSSMALVPGARSVTVWTDFTARGLPLERVRWHGDWDGFVRELATARTFGFVDEADSLRAAGRARGIAPESVMVFGKGGIADARFAQPSDRGEPARHKLLDAIGDLALLGATLVGSVTLVKPGHARTLQLLRMATEEGALGPRR